MEDNELKNTTEPENSTGTADTEVTAEETEAAAPVKTKTFGQKLLDDVVDIAESTIITIFVIAMIFTYFLHPVGVEGGSMNPTLIDKDRILMTTVYFGIDYGDIIVIDNDYAYDIDENGDPVKVNIDGNRLKECIIKRVIATPGQEIDLRDGKVYIDGKEIDEPYIASDAQTLPEDAFSGKYPFKVPDGYYFVMGDNREHSSDSHNSGVGLIKKDQIYGKAIVRYQPIKDFKLLGNSVNESAN